DPAPANGAAYHCPTHPLAHSAGPGKCPICAGDLAPTEAASRPVERSIPADADFVCPMEECWEFSAGPGQCPKCGMRLKPVHSVAWAATKVAPADSARPGAAFMCPMHPDQTSATRGTCPVCGMQLVPASSVPQPASAPAVIATQVDHLMEHYLALQKRFASDSTREVALHALGLVGAADEILRLADDPEARLPAEFFDAVRTLRAAALRTNSKDLDADRVTFVGLGGAMKRVIEHVRPSVRQYPRLYLFHCPMTKGDWIQASEEMANPFYGFKMLKCGERTGVK
ncbi:MAG TPA: heavy metal-binding domain-containing protein, partial [Phycisphaerae bacterium]|nr:heavy metal-binding domain-containing protein [Phycisphaerae bacterium]